MLVSKTDRYRFPTVLVVDNKMSNNSPISITEKATSELNTTDDWQLIMEICDRIPRTTSGFVDKSSFSQHETVS